MKLLTLTLAVLCVTLTLGEKETNTILKRLLDLLKENEKRASCSGGATSVVSASMQDALVQKHNELRSGEGSSNMRKLVWNAEIADIAQQLANQNAQNNKMEHGLTKDCSGGSIGQNLYMSSGHETELTKAVQAWFSEKKFTTWGDYKDSCPNEGQVTPAGEKVQCGHYTQVVWAQTMEVGCGVAYSSSGATYIACDYRAAGNYPTNIYLKGAACSECGFDDSWDSGYKCENNLCAACQIGSQGCQTPGPNCNKLCKDIPNRQCDTLQCELAGNKGWADAYCRATCYPENCPASCGIEIVQVVNCDKLCKDTPGRQCATLQCELAGNKGWAEAYCGASCFPENCPASCGITIMPNCDKLCTDTQTCPSWACQPQNKQYAEAYCAATCYPEKCPAVCGTQKRFVETYVLKPQQ